VFSHIQIRANFNTARFRLFPIVLGKDGMTPPDLNIICLGIDSSLHKGQMICKWNAAVVSYSILGIQKI
jgi:hypothetical protein